MCIKWVQLHSLAEIHIILEPPNFIEPQPLATGNTPFSDRKFVIGNIHLLIC